MIDEILKIDQALKIIDHQIPDEEKDLFFVMHYKKNGIFH